MSDSQVFRKREIEIPEDATSSEIEQIILENDDIHGATKASEESDEPKEERSQIDDWELQHGKYGLEALQIKEIAKEFPYKMQFGAVDKYIREEISERGWSKNTKHYQEILQDLIKETGTEDMEEIGRLKKLYEYTNIVKKYKEIRKKKESFLMS